jgi:sugar lactone lactonase YvrE
MAILSGIVAFGCVTVAIAQDAAKAKATLNQKAMQAYQAKDYASFVKYEKSALALEPDNPRLLYNVACGLALQGNAPEAVDMLLKLAARQLDLGADGDGDFAAIRQTPEWARYEKQLTALRKPIVHSEVAFTISDKPLLATGIAIDPNTHDSYIASVRQRKIIKRTKDGIVSDFIGSAQDGFLASGSLLIDAQRRQLYASTSAVPFMIGYEKKDLGKSGLFVFDLQTGKLLRKAMLTNDGKQHFLNTLLLDKAGNAYVSDSAIPGVYRLRRDAHELELFYSADGLQSTQGLAFSDDDKTLYITDFTDGLWAIDMATKDKHRLDAPANVWLGRLDGLARTRDGFIAVQIVVKPERVLRLRLDATGRRIATAEILEMSHPDYEEPIQGIISGNDFFYIANSQLDLANAQTGALRLERARPTIVLRLPL